MLRISDRFKNKSKPTIGPYLDLGLQLAIAVGIGFGIGYFLDKRLHSLPVFIILGVLLGATAGMLNIYRTVFPQDNHPKRKNQ